MDIVNRLLNAFYQPYLRVRSLIQCFLLFPLILGLCGITITTGILFLLSLAALIIIGPLLCVLPGIIYGLFLSINHIITYILHNVQQNHEAVSNQQEHQAHHQQYQPMDFLLDENNENQCVVCWDRPKNTALLPCRHAEFCRECAVKCFVTYQGIEATCPLCRAAIERTEEI